MSRMHCCGKERIDLRAREALHARRLVAGAVGKQQLIGLRSATPDSGGAGDECDGVSAIPIRGRKREWAVAMV